MRKLLCGLACLAPFTLYAGPFIAPGASTTFGSIEMPESIHSGTVYNPAAGTLALPEDDKWRFSAFSSLSFAFEVGQLDNFVDDVNNLIDSLQDNLDLSQAADLIASFDPVLDTMGRDGYFKLSAGGNIPMLPVIWRSEILQGTLAVDASVSTASILKILDAPLRYNPITQGIDSNISAYIKNAAGMHFSVGYSRPVFETKYGKIYAGAKLNYDYLSLNKTVIPLADAEDVEQTVQDELFNFSDSQGQMSLDIGAVFEAKYMRVGVLLKNLNEPEYQYNSVGTDCLNSGGAPCFTAQSFRDEIDLKESHIANTQIIVSAMGTLGGLSVGGSYDVIDANSVLGEEEQYLRVVSSYSPTSVVRYAITNFRLGVEKNMTGSELTTANIGGTFFGWANLDLSIGLDFIEVEGASIPRKYAISFGISENF